MFFSGSSSLHLNLCRKYFGDLYSVNIDDDSHLVPDIFKMRAYTQYTTLYSVRQGTAHFSGRAQARLMQLIPLTGMCWYTLPFLSTILDKPIVYYYQQQMVVYTVTNLMVG